jgi:hypothetical protein
VSDQAITHFRLPPGESVFLFYSEGLVRLSNLITFAATSDSLCETVTH